MSQFLKLGILKPAIAIVLSLLVVVLGFRGFQRLEISYFPVFATPTPTLQANSAVPANNISKKAAQKLQDHYRHFFQHSMQHLFILIVECLIFMLLMVFIFS